MSNDEPEFFEIPPDEPIADSEPEVANYAIYAETLSTLPDFKSLQGFELAFFIAENSQSLENTLAALTEIVAVLRTGVPTDTDSLFALWSDVFEMSAVMPVFFLRAAYSKLALFEMKKR